MRFSSDPDHPDYPLFPVRVIFNDCVVGNPVIAADSVEGTMTVIVLDQDNRPILDKDGNFETQCVTGQVEIYRLDRRH